jgi:hypothetical protein
MRGIVGKFAYGVVTGLLGLAAVALTWHNGVLLGEKTQLQLEIVTEHAEFVRSAKETTSCEVKRAREAVKR